MRVHISGNVNSALLSRIIEHPHFVTLLDAADAYFKDAHKAGIQSRNDVINLATTSLKDFMKEHPENCMEISHDIRQLNAEKIGGDEADLNKLRNIFMSILKDIKADYGNGPQDIEQTEFQEMLAKIKAQSDDIQAKRPVTETDIANITASVLSGVDALDEAETLMFYELSKHLLERMSGGCD